MSEMKRKDVMGSELILQLCRFQFEEQKQLNQCYYLDREKSKEGSQTKARNSIYKKKKSVRSARKRENGRK